MPALGCRVAAGCAWFLPPPLLRAADGAGAHARTRSRRARGVWGLLLRALGRHGTGRAAGVRARGGAAAALRQVVPRRRRRASKLLSIFQAAVVSETEKKKLGKLTLIEFEKNLLQQAKELTSCQLTTS